MKTAYSRALVIKDVVNPYLDEKASVIKSIASLKKSIILMQKLLSERQCQCSSLSRAKDIAVYTGYNCFDNDDGYDKLGQEALLAIKKAMKADCVIMQRKIKLLKTQYSQMNGNFHLQMYAHFKKEQSLKNLSCLTKNSLKILIEEKQKKIVKK